MKRSWLKYLGFLGFLSLLAFVTSNPGFVGFVGFFGFFLLKDSLNDERFEINISKSARNAFVAFMVVFAAAVAYAALDPNTRDQTLAFAFVQSFAVQILVFTVSLVLYEALGSKVQ